MAALQPWWPRTLCGQFLAPPEGTASEDRGALRSTHLTPAPHPSQGLQGGQEGPGGRRHPCRQGALPLTGPVPQAGGQAPNLSLPTRSREDGRRPHQKAMSDVPGWPWAWSLWGEHEGRLRQHLARHRGWQQLDGIERSRRLPARRQRACCPPESHLCHVAGAAMGRGLCLLRDGLGDHPSAWGGSDPGADRAGWGQTTALGSCSCRLWLCGLSVHHVDANTSPVSR